MLAAFKLRAVPINVNYRYVEDELRYLLDDTDAARGRSSIASSHRSWPRSRGSLPELQVLVAVEDGSGAVRSRARRHRLRDRARRRPRPGATSGPAPPTTSTSSIPAGRPACPRASCGGTKTCSSARWAARRRRQADLVTGRDRRALPASRARVACPRARSCTAPRTGWRSARCSPAERSDPGRARPRRGSSCGSSSQREHANFMVIVGDAFARPMLDALESDAGKALDVSDLRVLLSGGAILSPAVKQRARQPAARRLDRRRLRRRPRRAGRGSPSSVGAVRSRAPRSSGSPTTRSCSARTSARLRRGVDRPARAARPDPARLLQGPREDGGDVSRRRRCALGGPR